MRGMVRIALLSGVAAGSLCLATADVQAGAFGLREQGAIGTGLSTAGAAADGAGLGSMFWNPATMTDYPGWQSSWSVSGIFPSSDITAQPGSALLPFGSQSGNVGQSAMVPASYSSYQLTNQLWLGLATNAPFGLVSHNPSTWAGSFNGIVSKVYSFDINPTVAYKINDSFSVAAGFEAMWLDAFQTSALTLPGVGGAALTTSALRGVSWGYGFTLGTTWKPAPGTEIGVGYRSAINEALNGSVSLGSPVAGLPSGKYPAKLTLDLPDSVTVGLRQQLSPAFTALVGFEWDDWSRLGNVPVVASGPLPPAGTVFKTIDFDYNNGWLASLGGEYKWTPNLTLRAGVAYEKSPIDNANRQITLPDADRIWTSVGASYQLTNKLSVDIGYAHNFLRNGTITDTTPVAFLGDMQAHIDIVSAGFTYRWDAPAAPAPVVAKY